MRHSSDPEHGFNVQEAVLKANARTKKWIAYSVVVGSFALFAIAGILIGLYLTGNLRQVLPDQEDSVYTRTHGDALTGDFAHKKLSSKKLDGSVDPLPGSIPVKLPTTVNPILFLAAKESDVVDKVADAASDAAEIVKDAAEDVVDAVKDAVGDAVDSVGDAASDVVDDVGDAIDTAKDGLEGIVDAQKELVEDIVDGAADLVKDAVDDIGDKTDDVFDDVLTGGDLDDKVEDIGDAVEKLASVTNDASDEVEDIFDDVFDDADDESDEVIEEAGDKLKDTLKKISEVGENIQDVLDDAGDNIKDGVEGVLDGAHDIADDSRDDGILEGIKTVIKGVGDSVEEVVDKTKDLVNKIGENIAPGKFLDDGVLGTDDLGDGLGDALKVGEFGDSSDILHDVLHDAVDDVDDSNDDTGEVNVKNLDHGNPGELHDTVKDLVDNIGDDAMHDNSSNTHLDKDDDDSDEDEDDNKVTIVMGKVEGISEAVKGAFEDSVDKDDGRNNDGVADVLDDVLDDGRENDSPVMHASSERLGLRIPEKEVDMDAANDDKSDDTETHNKGKDLSDDNDDDRDDNINGNRTDYVQDDINKKTIRDNTNNNDDDSDDDDNHNNHTTNNNNNGESRNDASDDRIIFGPSPAGVLLGTPEEDESPPSSVVHLNTGTFITVSRPRPAPVRTNRVVRITVSRNSAPEPVLTSTSNNNGAMFSLQSRPLSSLIFNNEDDDGRSSHIRPVVSSHIIHSSATFSTNHQSVDTNFQPIVSQLSALHSNPLSSVISTDPISPFTSVSSLHNPWNDQSDSIDGSSSSFTANSWQGQTGFGGLSSD